MRSATYTCVSCGETITRRKSLAVPDKKAEVGQPLKRKCRNCKKNK